MCVFLFFLSVLSLFSALWRVSLLGATPPPFTCDRFVECVPWSNNFFNVLLFFSRPLSRLLFFSLPPFFLLFFCLQEKKYKALFVLCFFLLALAFGSYIQLWKICVCVCVFFLFSYCTHVKKENDKKNREPKNKNTRVETFLPRWRQRQNIAAWGEPLFWPRLYSILTTASRTPFIFAFDSWEVSMCPMNSCKMPFT